MKDETSPLSSAKKTLFLKFKHYDLAIGWGFHFGKMYYK